MKRLCACLCAAYLISSFGGCDGSSQKAPTGDGPATGQSVQFNDYMKKAGNKMMMKGGPKGQAAKKKAG